MVVSQGNEFTPDPVFSQVDVPELTPGVGFEINELTPGTSGMYVRRL